MNTAQYASTYFPGQSLTGTIAAMNQPTVKDVLAALMDREGINAHQLAAKLADVDPAPPEQKKDFQPTIWRILNVPGYTPTLPTLRVLGAYFKKSVSQLLGETPLESDTKAQTILRVMQELPDYKKDVLLSTALTLAESEKKRGVTD